MCCWSGTAFACRWTRWGGSSGGIRDAGEGRADIGMSSKALSDADSARHGDADLRSVSIGFDAVALPLARVLWTVLRLGMPGLSLEFLTTPMRGGGTAGGVSGQIGGTLILLGATLAVCLPGALGVALWIATPLPLPRRLKGPGERLLLIANAIPSVLVGLFAMVVFSRGLGLGKSWLAGGLVLGMMILPSVALVLVARFRAAPPEQVAAAAGLGFSRTRLIRSVYLPRAWSGAVTGLVLGLARAAGETAPILFTAAVFSGASFPEGVRDAPVPALPYHIFVLAQDVAHPDPPGIQPPAETETCFEVRGLNVFAGKQLLLRDIHLNIPAGCAFGLIGPSGAGKSTLLSCLNRMVDLQGNLRVEGIVRYRGRSVRAPGVSADELRRRVGVLFQRPAVFPGSVGDNVLFGVKRLYKLTRAEKRERLETALREAALWEEVKDRLTLGAARLSIGQQQRLCLARTLAMDPEVILMDEPTSALDPAATAKIEERIVTLKQTRTVVLVTHDLGQARRVTDWVACLCVKHGAGELTKTVCCDAMLENPDCLLV